MFGWWRFPTKTHFFLGKTYFLNGSLDFRALVMCCFSQIGCASRIFKQIRMGHQKESLNVKDFFQRNYGFFWRLRQFISRSWRHVLGRHFYLETSFKNKKKHAFFSQLFARLPKHLRRVDTGKGPQELATTKRPSGSKVQTAPTLPLRPKTNGTPTNGSCRNSVKEAVKGPNVQRPSSKGAVVRMKSAPRILGKG